MNAAGKTALLNLPSDTAKQHLESLGYHVTVATDVNQALQALMRSHYDLAVLDPEDPHHDVIFSHVRALCPGVVVRYRVTQ